MPLFTHSLSAAGIKEKEEGQMTPPTRAFNPPAAAAVKMEFALGYLSLAELQHTGDAATTRCWALYKHRRLSAKLPPVIHSTCTLNSLFGIRIT